VNQANTCGPTANNTQAFTGIMSEEEWTLFGRK
jgi:hypothetical protein